MNSKELDNFGIMRRMPSAEERRRIVLEYDGRRDLAEAQRLLWASSQRCRIALLAHGAIDQVESFVWDVKTKWNVSYFKREHTNAVARALAGLEWSEDLFQPLSGVPQGAADWALDRVRAVVRETQRVVREELPIDEPREEWALASKTLHWLLPWRVPAYDRNVRESLGIKEEKGAGYESVARKALVQARETLGDGNEWMGTIEPLTPLRGLDKVYWWSGGGKNSKALRCDP